MNDPEPKGLIILAQDIRSIRIGLFLTKTKEIIKELEFQTEPDGYLKAIDQALEKWKTLFIEISLLLVVIGPGSFTASRVSTTIANALSFSKQLKVIGIENKKNKSMADLLNKVNLSVNDDSKFVEPLYDKPPHITKAKA